MSLAKLTSLSTQTLSLLLERQRLQTLSRPAPTTNLPQIIRNLNHLRIGIVELENAGGKVEAVGLLRNQHERMRGMLGPDGEGVERVPSLVEEVPKTAPPSPPPKELVFTPYTDDPSPTHEPEPSETLQQQQMMMAEQDTHLENLSHSIGRQRDISIQINDELDVHTGLLEELDLDLDRTESRLSGARRKLDRFGKGIKGNGSTVTIGVLILILLILIIIFKT